MIIKKAVMSNFSFIKSNTAFIVVFVFLVVRTFNKTKSHILAAFNNCIISFCKCTKFLPGRSSNNNIRNIKTNIAAVYFCSIYSATLCNNMNKRVICICLITYFCMNNSLSISPISLKLCIIKFCA